jgi:hypothetical protein
MVLGDELNVLAELTLGNILDATFLKRDEEETDESSLCRVLITGVP